MIWLNIPSPSISSFSLGPLTIHFYALCILTGMFVAWSFGARRAVARGGNRDDFDGIVLYAIVIGIIGARIYHVITHYQDYFGAGRDPWAVFKVWEGGLAIMGGLIAGSLTILYLTKRKGISTAAFLDALAPGVLFAQGIGRLGNWFNQELFGLPTNLPWALEIDAAHRPPGFADYETFHPTFLYEMIWNITGGFVLVWLERRFKLGHGRVFALYLAWYMLGRSFIEAIRIDPSNEIWGIRVNNLAAGATFIVSLLVFAWLSVKKPGQVEDSMKSSRGDSISGDALEAGAVTVESENTAD